MVENERVRDGEENKIADTEEYIRILISDTGAEIPPDIINSIFEPYFTTKKIGDGKGLGLAVVHGIVESYGGTIEVESRDGRGTNSIIFLPETENTLSQKENNFKIIPKGNERILLVDDEPVIAQLGDLILSALGYRVTSMTDSMEALEVFQQNPYDFDLVITDMMMPGMSGEKLSHQISLVREDLPIIICSGYGPNSSVDDTTRGNRKSYLNKPYSKSEIADKIRKVLDR
ncbi:response regulator [Oceanispirochaeta sp.]|jgi:CheY-like chemotaxis protein|uniref:response regulator n=1 Tax=Oceanispirochaeta sp. TaxID=2035350 RepID=UPI002628BA91|nr:response regulator [Oceanispirochaeta sp.]MDA3956715.1 response regulator [Oceanispirochaeta sp.]